MADILSSPSFVPESSTPVPPGCTTPRPSIPAPAVSPTQGPRHPATVSPSWLQDPMRYTATLTPPTGIPEAAVLTPDADIEIVHVSYIGFVAPF
jgi:hypothetical protein